MAVGLSDVLDMWLGESERKLHEIFEEARRNAPCVLFFDEVDAIGQKRSQLRTAPGLRYVVNQLLAELDGVATSNEGVFIVAATNHPWDVDTALRRPGRFARLMLVLPPDKPARVAILRLNLKDRPWQGIDFGAIGAKTEEYSGADLVHLTETAAESALEAGEGAWMASRRLAQATLPVPGGDAEHLPHRLRVLSDRRAGAPPTIRADSPAGRTD